jgi:hypothetical protein
VCGGKRGEKALLRGLGETRRSEAAKAALTPSNSKNTGSGAGFQPGGVPLTSAFRREFPRSNTFVARGELYGERGRREEEEEESGRKNTKGFR